MKIKEHLPFFLLLLAILIKFSWFYNMTAVRNHYIVIVLITSVIYTGLIILLSKKPWLSITVSALLTLLFEGEVVYFRYFNKLLSFSNFSQAKFALDVSDVMFGLIRYADIVLLIDLVVLAVILMKHGDVLHLKRKYKAITASMILMIVPFLTLASFGNEFAVSVMNQEFFMYHTKDGIEVYNHLNQEVVIEAPEPIETEEESIVEEKAYKGIFEGRNLITIQVESLQDMMLLQTYDGQEITPFLNQLIQKDSFYFSSYYQQLGRGNTSDSEFSSHNSMYPSMDGISYERYQDYDFKGLPVLLKDRGYETVAFHGNEAAFWCREEAYPNQGFDTFYSSEKLEMDDILGMGLSDQSLFAQGTDILKTIEEPFYGFFITLTNHNPYVIPEELIGIEVSEEDKSQLFGRYIESVRYTDEAIESFYNQLEASGLLENSVVIIYGDHHGIPSMDPAHKDRVSEFLGYDYDFDEMMNIPLIIHAPGSGITYQSDDIFDQQDLLPTLVNLFNIDESLNMMGQDMLNTEDYFALFQTYMLTGSFMKDDTVFEMSRDGVFENSRAYNRKTREPIDVSECREGYSRALYEIAVSKYLLENNKVVKESDVTRDVNQ
ncbi:MAG: LTA synthase family protein [Clostridiales bacterium]|nr:LTA synthase family protein [Clostridiales bacterium]